MHIGHFRERKRMTPREKLIENIIDIVHATHGTPNDGKMAHFVRLLAATLKTHYAIARWVPVSERLPEFEDGQFMGWIRFNDGSLEHDLYSDCMIKDYASHWLELDIPEVES